jgi:phage gp37-like protein
MSGPVENLLTLRDAIVARLVEKLPAVPSIEPHGGSFDEKEIKRFAVTTPAIRVALMGFGKVERHASGSFVLPAQFAVVIVARDKMAADDSGKLSRDALALLVANAVTLAVAGHRFGLQGVLAPENLRGENLYSGAIDTTGLALWQVAWTTPVLLGESVDETLAQLSKLIINGVVFADPDPTGADPMRDPPNWPEAP